jgi:hypothetical protein
MVSITKPALAAPFFNHIGHTMVSITEPQFVSPQDPKPAFHLPLRKRFRLGPTVGQIDHISMPLPLTRTPPSLVTSHLASANAPVGGNRARRWTPTQQPPDSSALLRRGHGRRPPQRRTKRSTVISTLAKQATLFYN